MDIDPITLWQHMNVLVRGVVLVLTAQALMSIYVAFDRLLVLVTSGARSRRFAKEAGPLLERGELEGALAIARRHDKSHLAGLVAVGLATFLTRREEGHGPEKAAELTKRALEREGESLSERLNRGLGALASTGSTAPFVGLLGTVLGILQAFRLIGEEASGGMGTIGPAISEALVVTGYGLLVAIPTVLVFNALSGRLSRYEAGLANAASELVDRLEAGTPVARREADERDVEVERAGIESTGARRAVPSAA